MPLSAQSFFVDIRGRSIGQTICAVCNVPLGADDIRFSNHPGDRDFVTMRWTHHGEFGSQKIPREEFYDAISALVFLPAVVFERAPAPWRGWEKFEKATGVVP